MQNVAEIFAERGGQFVAPFSVLKDNLAPIKAFVFDWDGVFNKGFKGGGMHSGFSEIDSMGINLLRFGLWLKNHKTQPVVALITGAENPAAYEMSTREHFTDVYFKVPHKLVAFEHFLKLHSLHAYEVAFVFDDILDVPVARTAGVRYLIYDSAKVWFNVLLDAATVDYATALPAGEGAVREVCELSLSALGLYEEVFENRIQFSEKYKEYWEHRNVGHTSFYTLNKNLQIEATHIQ
jgi:3-deoxy-D-manno-octulosonate 8-phosphate phosphatase (KDO 8-P phosphatase)